MNSNDDSRSNLEKDLYKDPLICEKAKDNYRYSQNLYAALCNNKFQKIEPWLILKGEEWSCSWRYAGGIASFLMDGNDNYMDFYCSGMGFWNKEDDTDSGFVAEGMVTDEIREDLKAIGWTIIESKEDI